MSGLTFAGIAKLALVQERKQPALFGVTEKTEHVGKSTLSASLIPNDRNQILVQGQRTLKPAFRQSGVRDLMDFDGLHVFGRVCGYDRQFAWKVPNEHSFVILIDRMLQTGKRGIRFDPGKTVADTVFGATS